MSNADPSRPAEPESVSGDGAFVASARGPLPKRIERAEAMACQADGGGPVQPDRYIGTDIDSRYTVEALVGSGGMGLVYRARHRAIDKIVAIKIMRADLAKDREATSRFATEARAASAVGSAHIINVTDFGVVPDGSTYFVMEYLEGLTLAEVLEKAGRLPQGRLLNIAGQIAEGLGDAHEQGIVHRDLKPENVFLVRRKDTDFVKILDFGIAKINNSKSKVTRTGQIFGTPHYMSPEQARGLPVDHRSDLYSLGAILYEMATGRVPFDGDNPMIVLSQHVHEPPVPPTRLVGAQSLSTDLDAVILKCLAKNPAHRYATMAGLIDDLHAIMAGTTPRAVGHEPGTIPGAQGLGTFGAWRTPERRRPVRHRSARPRHSARWALGLLAGAVVVGATARVARQPTGVMRPLFVYGATRVAAVLYRAAPQIEPGFSFSLAGATRPVALLLSPIDAEAFENGRSLGMMPLTLQVPVGQKVAIVVKRDGYWSRAVLVDDTQARQMIRLSPIPGAPSAQAATELEEPALLPLDDQATEGPPESPPVSEQAIAPTKPTLYASPPTSSSTDSMASSASAPSAGKTIEAPSAPAPHSDSAPTDVQSPLPAAPEEVTPKRPNPADGDHAESRPGGPSSSDRTESAPPATESQPSSPPPEPKPAAPEPSDQAPTEPESAPPTSPHSPAPTDSGE